MVVAAIVLGVVLPDIDDHVDAGLPGSVTTFLFGGGASEARQLLSSIASGLITTVSLTFSLTVVVFQLASSQYSPRLLRLFPRDTIIRVTLGMLAGTFVYALTVLRNVRADGVPRISVTIGFLATAGSVVLLVVFLGHVVTELRVETMLRRVHREHDRVEAELFDDAEDSGADSHSATFDDALGAPRTVAANGSGFLTAVDEADLVRAACEADVVIRIERTVGQHVTVGTPLAVYRRRDPLPEADADALLEKIHDTLVLGYERNSAQDVGFGLRQLTDVYVKALSPGVNDPTTAGNALGHIAAVLAGLAGRDLSSRRLTDEDGVVRVFMPSPDFATLVEGSLGPVRTFGCSDPVVVAAALDVLRDVGWCARTDVQRDVVRDQLDRTVAAARRSLEDPADVERVEAAATKVSAALAQRWE